MLYSSCDLGTFEFCAQLLLGGSTQFSLFDAARFLLFLRVAILYGKNSYQRLILDCLLLKRNSYCCFTVSNNTVQVFNKTGYKSQYYKILITLVFLVLSFLLFISFFGGKHNCLQAKSRNK